MHSSHSYEYNRCHSGAPVKLTCTVWEGCWCNIKIRWVNIYDLLSSVQVRGNVKWDRKKKGTVYVYGDRNTYLQLNMLATFLGAQIEKKIEKWA